MAHQTTGRQLLIGINNLLDEFKRYEDITTISTTERLTEFLNDIKIFKEVMYKNPDLVNMTRAQKDEYNRKKRELDNFEEMFRNELEEREMRGFGIGGSRASQMFGAVIAKWKKNKLGKVKFDDERPSKVSKYVVSKMMNKDKAKSFSKKIKKENIKYINSLYPNLSRSDYKQIYKIMLENIKNYKDSKDSKGEKKTPQEKLTIEAVEEVEKDIKDDKTEYENDSEYETSEEEEKPKKTKANLKKMANEAIEKTVEAVIKKKIKDMTPEEKKIYNREAKRRQYKREKGNVIIKGGKPSDKAYFQSADSSYKDKAFNHIDGYNLIFDGQTIDAFLNEGAKEIIIGIKGTTMNMNDLMADIKIIGNNLNKSDRYQKDLKQFNQILQNYPPDTYNYYLSGHSLGGAIVKQMKKDFSFIKDSMTFNSASQPMDLVEQDNEILDNYIDKDFLYNLTGRFVKNKKVYPYKAKETKGVFGWLKQKATPTALNAHKLEQFDFMGKGKK